MGLSNLLRGCVFAGLMLSASAFASAAVVNIGLISYDELIPPGSGIAPTPGVNGFTIYNFTGSNISGDDISGIDFTNVAVTLNGGTPDNVGTIAANTSVQPDSLKVASTALISSAAINGALSTSLFTFDGQPYLASSNTFSAVISPSTPPFLSADVDFALIFINATPVVVTGTPEPAFLLLAAIPLVALALVRKRQA